MDLTLGPLIPFPMTITVTLSMPFNNLIQDLTLGPLIPFPITITVTLSMPFNMLYTHIINMLIYS